MVQVAVGVAPVVVSGRDSKILTITFYNASPAGQGIFLTKYGAAGLAAANAEYFLLPGVMMSFLLEFEGQDIQGEWGALATAAGGLLQVGTSSMRAR